MPLLLLSQILLAAACYAAAPTLPLFWDDVTQFNWLHTVGVAELWQQTVPGLNYFRPLAFTVWKLLAPSPLAQDAALLHVANVALHAANAWLLGLIVRGLVPRRRWWTALAAASLFTLFPFSFQAILPVSSLMHPLHAAAILLATLAFMQYLRAGHLAWLITSVVMVAAALFSHENGVLAPALVTLTALCLPQRPPWRRLAIALAPVWLAALAGFVLWNGVPRGAATIRLGAIFEQPESRVQNTALFLQGLTFPASMLARPLQSGLSIQNDLFAVGLVGVPAVLLWWALAGWRRQPAWALAWYAVAALPAIALLGFSYVLESPRLLYLASAGAAAFWAMPLGTIASDARAAKVRLGLASVVIVGACAWGFAYVQRRATLYQAMGQSIAQLQAAAQDRACESPSGLAINFPAWYFVRDPEFVLGHDGITTLSEGGSLGALLELNSPWRGALATAALPDVLNAQAAFVPLGEPRTHDALQPALRDAGRVIVNDPASPLGGFTLAGCRLAQADAGRRAAFGDALELVGASIAPVSDRAATVTLDWRARALMPEDVTVFVHVIDAAGQLVAQKDGYPLGGASPMRTWQAGDLWRDVRSVQLPAGAAPGEYTVLAGAYRSADGVRLPASAADGQPAPGDAVIVGTW